MKILFIAHRIPYPPNKGDKIRSYNFLKYLSERHEIFLASHIDEPADRRYAGELNSLVQKHVYEFVYSRFNKVRSGMSLVGKKPLSVSFFYSPKIQHYVDNLVETINFDAIFCYSSPTAEYIFRSRHYNEKIRQIKLIMDFIDVDSHKWLQYAQKARGPMRWIYLREAKCLQRYERRISEEFDHLLLVSEQEKNILLKNIPTDNVCVLANGVDLEHFSGDYQTRPAKSDSLLVFTGSMDYWPNIEGVKWFVKDILPRIQKNIPNVIFYIVGSRPTPAVRKLALKKGVEVTGYVDDIREYLFAADVCVVPIRVARGIQNKVLEAMAMGKAVVSTSCALEGIKAAPGTDIFVADDEEAFAASVVQLLEEKATNQQIGQRARQCAEKNYSWDKNLSQLNMIIASAEPNDRSVPAGGIR